MDRVEITQTRSAIGQSMRKKDTLSALGLGKIGRKTQQTLTPSVVGMLKSVQHMVVIKKAVK